VWALHEEPGHRRVVLRNPWAHGEPRGDGKDDGIFEMPIEDVMLLFEVLTVGG
jgi:hypothetical protein